MSLTEKTHAGGFIMSEMNGKQSRENVTLISGQNIQAGAVLGKITASGKYTAVSQGASDGSEAAAAVSINAADATGGDVTIAVLVRNCEVNGDELDWGSESPTEETTGIAELNAAGIIVR